MPKKPKETYQEYRDRKIDSVSPSFCAAKWYNATVWLNSGTNASCHHPPAHKIPLEDLIYNPKVLHNTKYKKMRRREMLKGSRPKECEYCWKVEDIGRNNVSDRVYKSVIYTDEQIDKIPNEYSWDSDVNLITLEIAFDRTCQFECSYCNSSFSTTWAKDIKKNGAYQDLVSDGAAAFQHDGSWADPFRNYEKNPYIEAFWKWWPELSTTLEELRITGGEPLMSPDVWKLFKYFNEHGFPEQMKFSINSNLGASQNLIDKLIKESHYCKFPDGGSSFDLYTSVEAVGKQAEYIRKGLDWEYWCKNATRLMEEGNVRTFNIMMTINSLCLWGLTDFMDYILKFKEKYGTHMGLCSFNILRFPSFQSAAALPPHLKQGRKEHIQSWLEENINHPNLHQMEKDGIQKVIDYLGVVDQAHARVSSGKSLERDFKTFYSQYDTRKNLNFENAFEGCDDLLEWYREIPITETGRVVDYRQVDGDSTKGWGHSEENIKAIAEREGWVEKPKSSNPNSETYDNE
tara:strand:+ start:384 stop:1931 length:1548 start_codon:yes stop_codon:yes gene_type:complete